MTTQFDVERVRYDVQRPLVPEQWNSLVAMLRTMGSVVDYDQSPWRLVSDLNGIVKHHLEKKPTIDSHDIDIARAGFDVALEFQKVELASDFLTFLPAPSAKRVCDFLYGVRLALKWGTWAIDAKRLEKWLDRARVAICNCPDWIALNPTDRFRCHEVMMGRLIKLGASLEGKLRTSFLANVAGDADDEDIENTFGSEVRALRAGIGEMTLNDLGQRLYRSSRETGAPIAVLSLYVTPEALSYHMDAALPTSDQIISESSVAEIRGFGRCLDTLLAKRNSFSFDDAENIEDVIGWPLQLRQLFRKLFGKLGKEFADNPSYVLLAVNMPYQGLPWQHLISDAMKFSAPSLLVSILPNFSFLITATDRTPISGEPTLVCYPSIDTHIADDVVRAALEPIEVDIRRFRENPPFTLAFITAHGSDTDCSEPAASDRGGELVMPRFMIDGDRHLMADQLSDGLGAQILCLFVCRAGAPKATFFNDVGGVLSPFLMEQRGLMFAPIADLSPKAATTFGKNVLECQHRDKIIHAYSAALRENPECYLFNAYGLPTTYMLA